MSSFVDEFKAFIMRGNVVDLAVGVIIGAAFGKIVSSLVTDILMPPIGVLLGGVDFSSLFINLSDGSYDSLAEAQAAGAATINYGLFINNIIDFLIVAVVIFIIIRQINRLQNQKKTPAEEVPNVQQCPYCLETVPAAATRCKHCTSELTPSPTASAS